RVSIVFSIYLFFTFILLYFFCFFVFFFQAEDGIRDATVTGVQTVLFRSQRGRIWIMGIVDLLYYSHYPYPSSLPGGLRLVQTTRSEERRVGKECRTRRSRDH